MSGKVFLDTNIFVYAVVQDDPRSHDAEKLIAEGGRISAQVLNEFAAVVRRKTKMPWNELQFGLENIKRLCPNPLPIAIATHQHASAIAEKYGYKIYDALIAASALEGRCTTLYSEDIRMGRSLLDS